MTTLRRAITGTATGLLLMGLAACSSGTESAPHDHDAHESPADVEGAHEGDAGDNHAAMGHGDPAMGEHDAGGAGDLKKVTPSADYPLTTCVVSGEPLDAMGEALAYEYKGQEVQFCCEGCLDDFKASPDEYLAKVKEARAR